MDNGGWLMVDKIGSSFATDEQNRQDRPQKKYIWSQVGLLSFTNH